MLQFPTNLTYLVESLDKSSFGDLKREFTIFMLKFFQSL